jgi:hypothetical protein
MFYPTSPVVIAVAADSVPLTVEPDALTQIVPNPGFSVIGCVALFHAHKYAEFAFILHDTMTIVKPIPADYTADIQFVYHFIQPGMGNESYSSQYAQLLSPADHDAMVKTQLGCFGPAFFIRHSAIERLGILPLVPKVTTKAHMEAMERVVAYLATKNGLLRSNFSICGHCIDFYNPPWSASMTFEELLQVDTPFSVLKVILGRA